MRAAIHMAGAPARSSGRYVRKAILRTGTWPVTPTTTGTMDRPLRIVRDGKSDASTGTIALAEVVENFKAGAVQNVQIPLTDDEQDHKNLTRLNTGFVRDLWIVDEAGGSTLIAAMEFTDPDVRAKVLNGTYADVSCGIPWRLTSRGRNFGSTLEHVALTNRPFIDGLGPFLAASIAAPDAGPAKRFGPDQMDHRTALRNTPLPSAPARERVPDEVTRGRARQILDAMRGTDGQAAAREAARTTLSAMQGDQVDEEVRQRAAGVRAALRGGR
jgi:hypothetical protein